jgi:hypothetical protein
MVIPMDEPQLSLLPAAAFVPLVHELKRHLAMVANYITGFNFASMLDGHSKRLIGDALERVRASAGSIWIVDAKHEYLMVAFNTGPHAKKEMEHFKQPLTAGIVSMSFSNEHSFLENEIQKNSQHDKTLDSKLHVKTQAMIVTPFYFLGGCRGVLTCVQIDGPEATSRSLGFAEHDLSTIRHAAAVLGKLVDARILRTVVGLG